MILKLLFTTTLWLVTSDFVQLDPLTHSNNKQDLCSNFLVSCSHFFKVVLFFFRRLLHYSWRITPRRSDTRWRSPNVTRADDVIGRHMHRLPFCVTGISDNRTGSRCLGDYDKHISPSFRGRVRLLATCFGGNKLYSGTTFTAWFYRPKHHEHVGYWGRWYPDLGELHAGWGIAVAPCP